MIRLLEPRGGLAHSPARAGLKSRNMRTQLRTSILVVAVLALGLPAAAHASAAAVIRDCAQDGKLDHHYSQKDLRKAEQTLPSDIDEYTDCRSVIRAAMGGGSGSSGVGPANGIATPSGAVAGSPADIAALNDLASRAAKGKRGSIDIGGRHILPGNAGLSGVLAGLQGSNAMPTSLLLAMAALILFALTTAYLGAREKFPLLRRAALRLFRR
jgi:hypothetical protein